MNSTKSLEMEYSQEDHKFVETEKIYSRKYNEIKKDDCIQVKESFETGAVKTEDVIFKHEIEPVCEFEIKMEKNVYNDSKDDNDLKCEEITIKSETEDDK